MKTLLPTFCSRRDVSLNRLFLVEEWRGVVKPLHPDSKIKKLWEAWGEERSHVQFIVKKSRGSANSLQTAATCTGAQASALPHR